MKESLWSISKISTSGKMTLLLNLCLISVAIWQEWSAGSMIFFFWIQALVRGLLQAFLISKMRRYAIIRGKYSGYINIFAFICIYFLVSLLLLFFLFILLAIAAGGSLSASISMHDLFPHLLIFSLILISICGQELFSATQRNKKYEEMVDSTAFKGDPVDEIIVMSFMYLLPLCATLLIAFIPAIALQSNLVILTIFMLSKMYLDLIVENFVVRLHFHEIEFRKRMRHK